MQGGGLAPWLDGAIATLAGGARVVALFDAPGTTRLPARRAAVFAHGAGGGDDDHDRDHDHAGDG
ncbi:MAG: zinc transporter, partial [Thermoanaerobaculia bacterium]|nr:zinc transporter [Thermoanaerobaculia bacterium]